MRFTPNEIVSNLQMIVDITQEPVNAEDPHSIAEKLAKLSSILGLGSKCCGNAEYYYQTNKKSPEYNELRTFADSINKDLHYVITSLQSILKVATIDYVDSKNQN
jgi:hypothetical protein